MGKPSSEVVQFALVGPGRSQALMAHIIVSKFGDHLPSRLARACHWETSTLSGWVPRPHLH
jgi:hypothetical protein